VREGTMSTVFPEQATEMCFYLILGLGDKFGEIILGNEAGTIHLSGEERFQILKRATAAYTDALERILGASRGSIQLMDDESIHVWVD